MRSLRKHKLSVKSNLDIYMPYPVVCSAHFKPDDYSRRFSHVESEDERTVGSRYVLQKCCQVAHRHRNLQIQAEIGNLLIGPSCIYDTILVLIAFF